MIEIKLIISLGTQIVSRIEIKSAVGELLCPMGAVGVIVGNAAACCVQIVSGKV